MSSFKPNILYVEDEQSVCEEISRFLQRFSNELYTAHNGQKGLEIYLKKRPDIVISDIKMPQMDGLEMLSSIKKENEKQYAILTTAFNDSEYLLEAIDLQLDGYLLKPIDLKKLKKKIEHIIEHITLKQELRKKIYNDSLTNLYSRHTFFEDIYKQNNTTVILIDIDEFKVINEVYGSKIGSKVLVAFAKRLQELVSLEKHRVYRISGDEFALLYADTELKPPKLQQLIDTLLENLDYCKFSVDGYTIQIDITIGISQAQTNGYETAKAALDHAKYNNKPFFIYSIEIDHTKKSSLTLQIKDEIVQAIESKRVILVYHPIVDKMRNILKYEALMRIQKENSQELLLPYYFLEVAKKTKLYDTLSSHAIFSAMQHAHTMKKTITINFAYSDIISEELLHKIEDFLQQHKDAGEHIIFELTESEHFENYKAVNSFVRKIKAYGVQIAIDDFGSGYSNFEHILRLEPNYLKIDGSLIKDIDKNRKSLALVEAIVGFCHKLDVKVVAEFVHSKVIFEILQTLDVDEYQGFYFSEPLREIE